MKIRSQVPSPWGRLSGSHNVDSTKAGQIARRFNLNAPCSSLEVTRLDLEHGYSEQDSPLYGSSVPARASCMLRAMAFPIGSWLARLNLILEVLFLGQETDALFNKEKDDLDDYIDTYCSYEPLVVTMDEVSPK